MEVTFYGPLRLIQAALPGLRKRKNGTVVNISSIAGIDGLPSCGLYAASKFALEGMISAGSIVFEHHADLYGQGCRNRWLVKWRNTISKSL